MGKDRSRKSKDGDKTKQDQKEETKKPYVPKNKLRTGVTELEYNRYSATSFCNFGCREGVGTGLCLDMSLQGCIPPKLSPNLSR